MNILFLISLIYLKFNYVFILKLNEIFNIFTDEISKISFYKTALNLAIEKGNEKIVTLILKRPELDINAKSIWNGFILYNLKKMII